MTAIQITLAPHRLDEGPDYEKAAFGLLEIKGIGKGLTDVVRSRSSGNEYSKGPYASGYHLAEWLVWNWWRLRWEPRPPGVGATPLEWRLSHRMSDIGEGYRWPNITISCDGLQCVITSEPSDQVDTPSFRYLGATAVSIPATELEDAVDEFIRVVLERLDIAGIGNTNLQTLWEDLLAERNDPEVARFRKLEALLGFNPDETEPESIDRLLMDAPTVGENALAELATGVATNVLSAQQIIESTKSSGFDMNAQNAFSLSDPLPNQWGHIPAWRIGVSTARSVRQQAGLGDCPIGDFQLAELAGVPKKGLTGDSCTKSHSWVFTSGQATPRITFRTPRANGRRFDLARLMGDRLFTEGGLLATEPLSPATRSYSYRQKAQRAFAADLLSPWETVRFMLGNDYSNENMEQVAEHFAVSPLTISTLVLNNQGFSNDPEGERGFA